MSCEEVSHRGRNTCVSTTCIQPSHFPNVFQVALSPLTEWRGLCSYGRLSAESTSKENQESCCAYWEESTLKGSKRNVAMKAFAGAWQVMLSRADVEGWKKQCRIESPCAFKEAEAKAQPERRTKVSGGAKTSLRRYRLFCYRCIVGSCLRPQLVGSAAFVWTPWSKLVRSRRNVRCRDCLGRQNIFQANSWFWPPNSFLNPNSCKNTIAITSNAPTAKTSPTHRVCTEQPHLARDIFDELGACNLGAPRDNQSNRALGLSLCWTRMPDEGRRLAQFDVRLDDDVKIQQKWLLCGMWDLVTKDDWF